MARVLSTVHISRVKPFVFTLRLELHLLEVDCGKGETKCSETPKRTQEFRKHHLYASSRMSPFLLNHQG
ncbi:hypothetical protein HYFRA_00012653 [Hymenoscyphus fraxineus]|uniref:Uncharacterized protein n=1 Tax=Hymenoscyphus fraxineus TaxID=746836 RepID=A0A9N9L4K6_9HELO|nr:hypothetical protein HYFRA_00012653 [Hymenoscyphus fraxineus]